MDKTMKNESLLAKINDLLGEEKELIVLKGKLFSPAEVKRQEDQAIYYTFRLKVLKAANDDAYAQSFNTYFIIMPAEVAKRYTREQIREMKDNEVILLCSARAGTREFVNKNTGEKVTVNNISLYGLDIMFTRQIKKDSENAKALKI